MANYKTLEGISTGEYKDRGSKFIAKAKSVQSEDEAKQFIIEVGKEHHKARHVCYAYKIGIDQPIIRTNDDGEPANTGGQPILNFINKYNLEFVTIAVVRYFGGVLLGKGGLIKAYGGAAEIAIQNAKIIDASEKTKLNFKVNFTDYPFLMAILKDLNIQILQEQYDQNCVLEIIIEKDQIPSLKSAVSSLSSFETL